ncbi:MAG: hypothetical protein AAGH15_03215 [Myxococcota bacterium]
MIRATARLLCIAACLGANHGCAEPTLVPLSLPASTGTIVLSFGVEGHAPELLAGVFVDGSNTRGVVTVLVDDEEVLTSEFSNERSPYVADFYAAGTHTVAFVFEDVVGERATLDVVVDSGAPGGACGGDCGPSGVEVISTDRIELVEPAP